MSESTPQSGSRPLTVNEALQRAIAFHETGQLAEAERLYRAILQTQPGHPDANHNLGVLAAGLGKAEVALPFFKAALEANPQLVQFWVSYIDALVVTGTHSSASSRLEEGERLARAMTQRFPENGFGWHALGAILHLRGQNEEAVAPVQKAAVLLNGSAEVHNTLGAIFKHLGRLEEAEASCRHALEIKPAYAEAYSNLGAILHEARRLNEAEACSRRAIELRPAFIEPQLNLAKILQSAGRLPEAEACCRQVLATVPDSAEANSGLGDTLRHAGRLEEAERFCRRAIQLNPGLAEARANLGNVLLEAGRLTEAVASYEAGIQIKPRYAPAYNNLGRALKGLGRVDEAIASYRRGLELNRDMSPAHSNLLFALNYLGGISAAEIYAEHRRWGDGYAKDGLNPLFGPSAKDPLRRLRVGYVSPDLRQHSVAFFLEPVLQAHDHGAIEVFCYSEVLRPDAVTSRLQALADHWVSTLGLSDGAVARRIADDKIDILVDLAGHTADNRLLAFALRPAPIQVTWLGYPNTTGLPAMDYRLVDNITDPPGPADLLATEQLVRLEKGFLCYAAPARAPAVVPPPCRRNGYVTFGTFNNPAKYSSGALEAWSTLLRRARDSRLLLKSRLFDDADGAAAFLARLKRHGIQSDQVIFRGQNSGIENHLSQYGEVDIALDPFPYNGTTTTCEALWMGVPVVTLRGDRHASRVGASLLAQINAEEWIGGTEENYIDIAARLASDAERLSQDRHTLRQRMQSSTLCDAPAFARKLESAYRKMWRKYCGA